MVNQVEGVGSRSDSELAQEYNNPVIEQLDQLAKDNRPYASIKLDHELKQALKALEPLLTPEQIAAISFRKAPPEKGGDYGFACFAYAKELKKSPHQIAQEWAALLNAQITPNGYIDSFEAVSGYVNVHLNYETFTTQVLNQVVELGPMYGSENIGQGRHVIIDFSSPNIAKRMSIGHLRSTVIGDSLARIHDFLGYKVTRDNHIGDWGTGFGHIMHAIKTWGDMEAIAANPIEELQELYVKGTAVGEKDPDTVEAGRNWFLRLEQGDPEARELWQQIVHWSLEEFQKIYDILGIEFDEVLGESYYEDQLQPTIQKMKELGITKVSEGALIVDLKPEEDTGKVVVQRSDGASLYITRDIATAVYRAEQMSAEEIIYVVGDEQRPYFEELFSILKLMGLPVADYAKHVYFGLIRLPEGKMSTRKGRVVLLEELIAEAFSRTKEIIAEKKENDIEGLSRPMSEDEQQLLTKQIAVGALKWGDLSHDRRTSIVFDMKRAVTLNGNSAPYVQYTHARAQSVLEKLNTDEVISLSAVKAEHPLEREVVKLVAEFPKAVEIARAECDPSRITDLIYAITQAFNSMYMHLPILKADSQQERATRLGITASVAQTIRNGLYLLGIDAPNKM